MTAPLPPDADTERLLGQLADLRARGIVLFGIRHHSPACAHHLRRALDAVRPAFVLIEGPAELTPLVELMVHPETEAPFAAYCAYEAKRGREAAYYPFCDASPELVAVRRGRRLGADVRFVDLGFSEMCEAETTPRRRARRIRSLQRELHLANSAYLDALARETGCRDHDELWDHLFEARDPRADWTRFVEQVAVYCLMARRDHPDEVLEADGSAPREQRMAWHVLQAVKDGLGPDRPGIVVTGGFHTPALADWLTQKRKPKKGRALKASPPVLMRYGFEALDALNGYEAGMPSPAYYQALWRALEADADDPHHVAAAAMAVEVARLGRRGREVSPQAADEVTALTHAAGLAQLRGRAGPSRQDLKEALQTTLTKGAIHTEGRLVADLVRRAFTGRTLGHVPKEAGLPPIVEDFQRVANKLNVSADKGPREVALSLYTKDKHRDASRFLHALAFLEVPYGQWLQGPDYAAGEGLERRQERWRIRWSVQVEAELIDKSVYGPTVREAAAARLREQIEALREAGQGRDADRAVTLLVAAFVMGAHDELEGLSELVAAALAEDGRFERVVTALVTLVLSLEGREPLEVQRGGDVPGLAARAFERTLSLLPTVLTVPEARREAVVQALLSLRQLAVTEGLALDPSRLYRRVAELAAQDRAHPRVQGVLLGLAYGAGEVRAEDLAAAVRGHLLGTRQDVGGKVDVLFGVLAAAREVAWQVPAVLDGVTQLFASWDERTFLTALPSLRLAFSHLTPREIDRVARAIAAGVQAPPAPAPPFEGPPSALDEVLAALDADGLADWGRAP